MKRTVRGSKRVGRASRCMTVLCVVAATASCVRPTEERAARDLEVGIASNEAATVVVAAGLASVQRLEPGVLELWSQAPTLGVRLDPTANGPTEWVLDVRNAMADAELFATSDGQPIAVQTLAGEHATHRKFAFTVVAGRSVALSLHTPDEGDVRPWRFAVLSDVQEAIDRVGDVFARVNEQGGVRFLLGAGDLTERGTVEQLRRFKRELRALSVPYYTTLGNHELGTSPPPWHDAFGRGSFHFQFRKVHFSLLDTASATVDPTVYGWLETWLNEAVDEVHVVAAHIPPVDPIGVRNGSFASRAEAAKFVSLLNGGNVDIALYGHVHSFYAFANGNVPAYISGGGGAIPERMDGIGRHFLTVDIDPIAGVERTAVVRVD